MTGRIVNVSALRRESVAGRLARAPLRLIPAGAVLPVVQGPARGARWVVGSLTHGCWLGTYEADKVRRFTDALAPGSRVWDIGANVGYYTLIASRRVGPDGSVVAVEPLERNLAYLGRHIALNRLTNVTVVPAAVGSRVGWLRLDPAHHPSQARVSDDGPLTVEATTLDTLAGRHGTPDIVKMDIEGGETAAFAAADEVLGARRTVWFVALHGPGARRVTLEAFARHGYRVEPLDAAAPEAASEILATPH